MLVMYAAMSVRFLCTNTIRLGNVIFNVKPLLQNCIYTIILRPTRFKNDLKGKKS